MFTSEFSIVSEENYLFQRDLFFKFLLCLISMFTFVEIVRGQIAEVNLLQLIPGVYFFLLFLSSLFLLYFSNVYIRTTFQYENLEKGSKKYLPRMKIYILKKFSLVLFYWSMIASFYGAIPISLDSFSSSGEKSLENLWSFNEVISVEIVILSALLTFSQTPLFYLFYSTQEDFVKTFPSSWKKFSFVAFIGAGVFTPTIDGYTQISFAFSLISVFIILVFFIQRRVKTKTYSRTSLL